MGVHDLHVYDQVKDLLGIPLDEPIFILRGKDLLSLPTIRQYEDLRATEQPAITISEDWLRRMHEAKNEFIRFKLTNPHMMKMPD